MPRLLPVGWWRHGSAGCVDREEILAEMRRSAAENGGQPLGMGRFEIATGIKGSDWGRYWARFGDLQRDAGLQPNRLNTAYTEDHLFLHLITLASELGHYPTSREMAVRRNSDRDFPHRTVYSQRWSKAELVASLLAWCMDKPECEDIATMLKPLAEKLPRRAPKGAMRTRTATARATALCT